MVKTDSLRLAARVDTDEVSPFIAEIIANEYFISGSNVIDNNAEYGIWIESRMLRGKASLLARRSVQSRVGF